MYITEKGLARYLEVFHEAYVEQADARLPVEARQSLARYSLLPSRIRAYVSTSLGVGYEYVEGDAGIETRRSSSRIESLFFDLPLSRAELGPRQVLIGGPKITFEDCGFAFDRWFSLRLDADDAWVRLIRCRFMTDTGYDRIVMFGEMHADRSAEYWSEAAARRRVDEEIRDAEFYLELAQPQNIELGDYLARSKEKMVLILGDFGSGRGGLGDIKAQLTSMGYEPVILDEVPDTSQHYSLRQKFGAVAAIARFVVFEDSKASGHLDEWPIARSQDMVSLVLRKKGKRSTYMIADMELTSRVVKELEYEESTLETRLAEGVAWAEALIAELAARRGKIYPWWSPSADD